MKNWFQLIENYIDNDLSAEEKEQVLNLLSTDPKFAREYQLHLDVNKAILETEIISLRRNLREIHRNSKQDTGTTIRKLYQKRWHLAAASAAILLLIGSLMLSDQKTSQPTDIFDQYYQAETSIMIQRSNSLNVDSEVKTALTYYTNAEYEKAIEILSNNQENVISKFYLGLSYIETEDYKKAQEAFQSVLDHNDNLFLEQAEWYKALCLLKQDNISEAAKLFTEIKESNSLFKDQASDILRSIDQ